LRLRDAKPRYDVQTALEAEIELNLLSFDTPLRMLLEQVRAEVEAALANLGSRMDRLAVAAGANRERDVGSILTFEELPSRSESAEDPIPEEAALDHRASS